MSRQEFKSYEEVHAQLVEAMQEACTKDESGKYRIPDVVPGFIYEEYNSGKKSKMFAGRFSKIAAIFIIILLGMNFAMLNSGSGDVYGDKGLLHRIFEGNRGIYTDSENMQDIVIDDTEDAWIFEDLSQAKGAKTIFPELLVPGYVPKQYMFDSLKIYYDSSDTCFAEYEYVFNNSVLHINITSSEFNDMYLSCQKGSVINLPDRIICVSEDITYNTYIIDMYTDKKYVCIYGINSYEEIVRIAKNLR